jgi:large conductance mechanosensitive channel
MSFFQEFKEFASKGNAIDLAIGVIIGAAFGKIVNSLVEDIITPLILSPALKAANVEDLAKLNYEGIQYGLFLSAVISFFIITFALFIIVKAINKLKKAPEVVVIEEAPKGPSQEELLAEIRDLLKNK